MNVNERIQELKLVPVVVLQDAQDAVPLARALIAGGLPVAEITFRTDAAEASIYAISEAFPEMLVGAGTVTSREQAKRAAAAGAKFLVTAGFNRAVTEYAVEQKIPIYPGVCTPTELMLLQEYQMPVAKFFPAEQFGGVDTIQSLSGPFPKMRFMPTGGINPGNVREYLKHPKVIACGGSWMVKSSLIQEKAFDTIARLTAEAVALVKEG